MLVLTKGALLSSTSLLAQGGIAAARRCGRLAGPPRGGHAAHRSRALSAVGGSRPDRRGARANPGSRRARRRVRRGSRARGRSQSAPRRACGRRGDGRPRRACAGREGARPPANPGRRGRARAVGLARRRSLRRRRHRPPRRSRRARRCSRRAAPPRSGSGRRIRRGPSAREWRPRIAPAPRSPTSSSCSSIRRRSSTRRSCSRRRCAARAPLLLDDEGNRFTDELAPRDVVAREIAARGTVLLDLRAIDRGRFPALMGSLVDEGYDPAEAPIPVAPAAHYTVGGIVTDLDGRERAARPLRRRRVRGDRSPRCE